VEKVYYEDYSIGESFTSPGRTITETDIVLFAAFTGDWHPLHTDKQYAAETPFKERIAHGMLTLVIGGSLMHRLGPYVMVPKSLIAYLGMDAVRFTAPTKIGDTIHCVMTVKSTAEKNNEQGLIDYENRIINQRGETIASYVTKFLVGRNPKV
jgi:3-hydroxybutyryl-CoA dehydratase